MLIVWGTAVQHLLCEIAHGIIHQDMTFIATEREENTRLNLHLDDTFHHFTIPHLPHDPPCGVVLFVGRLDIDCVLIMLSAGRTKKR